MRRGQSESSGHRRLKERKPRRLLSPRAEQLYEFVGHKARFEQSQSCFWNVLFGLTVETGAIGPVNPRFPKARHRAAKAAAWASVFQASNESTGFHHTA